MRQNICIFYVIIKIDRWICLEGIRHLSGYSYFFQVREKPGARLSRASLHWHFWQQAFPTWAEVEARGSGEKLHWRWCGCFFPYHLYLFWPHLSSSCNCFQEEVCFVRAHSILAFTAVRGASGNYSFRKAKFPEKKLWGFCKYRHNSGMSQGLQNCKDSHNGWIFLDSCSEYLNNY